METGQGEGNMAESPAFASGWPNVDLHLSTGSPALNAGLTSFGTLYDIDGNPRDALPDLGAFEE